MTRTAVAENHGYQMIHSMTGYGDAAGTCAHWELMVEIRSVNHRYFKSAIKLPEFLQSFESDIDTRLRGRLSRGSVTCQVRARTKAEDVAGAFDVAALQAIVNELEPLTQRTGTTLDIATLLTLPGMMAQPEMTEADRDELGRTLAELVDVALDSLADMRAREGAALADDLLKHCEHLRNLADANATRAPEVVKEYATRLQQRVEQLLAGANLSLDESDLLREIALFAERSDITEEVTRIHSHLDQFEALCRSTEQAGRKLDFVAQELLRETNTIGSKANDATIARQVVDMKALIDRLKEQVQNVA